MHKSIVKKLWHIVGREHVLTAASERTTYGYDATPSAPLTLPEAVVFPASTEEIEAIVKLAACERIPLVPRGAGTNLTGGARPLAGGVVLSTQRLNRILSIGGANLTAVVQPGVVTADLQRAAALQGLFYPPDPQSQATCTLGGNLAENAGGPRAVKYGVTRQYVLGLEAVLPQAGRVRLGARTLKSVVGYDLVSLLVGSEGTLGVISEATLRLIPAPLCRGTVLAVFDELARAARAVSAIFQARILPSAIEFLDQASIRAVQAYEPAGIAEDAQAVLIVEVDGSETDVAQGVERVAGVMREGGARDVRRAASEQEAAILWKARRAVSPALARIAPLKVNEDIVVPLTSLPDAVTGIQAIAARQDLKTAIFGHAGDGNLHVNFLAEPGDAKELKRVERAVGEVFALVLSLGGSISGEHGIGTTKQAYLDQELGPAVMATMRAIKQVIDPLGIMNPGKIFPPVSAGS